MSEINAVYLNHLKPNGNYMYQISEQPVKSAFYIYVFRMILTVNSDYFHKQN
jgi:hypothetical protein